MPAKKNGEYQATHDYIIRQLGQHANRDDLILEVCQRMDIGWVEAEGMVEAVEQEYSREVARRRGPLLLVLGGGVLLAGLLLSGAALYFFAFEATFEGSRLLLDLENSYGMGVALIMGVGMTAGSVVGLVRVIGAMVEK